MPIEFRSFVAEDIQLSANELVIEFPGVGGILAVGPYNKMTWQWNPNTGSACSLRIEKSNDAALFLSVATLSNADGKRFLSTTAIESTFVRVRIVDPTANPAQGVVSARVWAEV